MSLCHPEDGSVSCGACCGLFNLKLDTNGYKQVLTERTHFFKKSVNFNIRHSIPVYRKDRENIESSIERKDEMTYNCPFLGYVDFEEKKIGCMIHPIFTGDPKSQNFSFYGTSICQSYDCKNKEHPSEKLLENFFQKITNDSIEYSHLASDHILVYVIESWLRQKGWNISEGFTVYSELLEKIFILRLESKKNFYPTSFEIRYSNFLEEPEIYEYLAGVLEGENKESILSEMKKAPARE